MKKEYDIVYLTNTPSFYKLNLCEALAAEGISILLVFYGYGPEAVNTRMESRDWRFDYRFLSAGDSHRRDRIKVFWRLLRLMGGIKARKVLYAGWLSPEYNLYSLISPRRRNVIINECRSEDISMKGIKGRIKRLVIGRMSGALPSGAPQRKLFEKLGFTGVIATTGSVGIINKGPRPGGHKAGTPLRFLYVGRLTGVKNLKFLVKAFNRNGLPLTIVGKGEEEADLRKLAGPNIRFSGFVDNDRLGEMYSSHDVFILPSLYEAWGLVVEEALYWGLPVIVSDKVGSGPDMVRAYGSGYFFISDDEESLATAINEMARTYKDVRERVMAMDFESRDRNQIDAYLKILES